MLPPCNGLLRRVWLLVLLPASPCGDGFLRPTWLPALHPRYGLLRRVWLVALVRRRALWRYMIRIKVCGQDSRVVVDVCASGSGLCRSSSTRIRLLVPCRTLLHRSCLLKL
jgi:hypothetical protein